MASNTVVRIKTAFSSTSCYVGRQQLAPIRMETTGDDALMTWSRVGRWNRVAMVTWWQQLAAVTICVQLTSKRIQFKLPTLPDNAHTYTHANWHTVGSSLPNNELLSRITGAGVFTVAQPTLSLCQHTHGLTELNFKHSKQAGKSHHVLVGPNLVLIHCLKVTWYYRARQ